MTNKEFYGDKLLAIVLESACHGMHKVVYGEWCVGKKCEDCEFNTIKDVENWLNAEHEEPEPPLLENGDGLKPGDWIMVRNSEEQTWVKRVFICYKDGLFWTIANTNKLDKGPPYIHCFYQARLPMEGE